MMTKKSMMVNQENVAEIVRDKARLTSTLQARQLIDTVLGMLVSAAPSTTRQYVLGARPELGTAVAELGTRPSSAAAHDLLDALARAINRSPQQTRLRTRVVLDAADAHDPTTLARIAAALPDGTVTALRQAAADPPSAAATASTVVRQR